MTLRSSSITILRGALIAAAVIGAVVAGLAAPTIADTLARKLYGSDASMVACAGKSTELSLRRDRSTHDKACAGAHAST